MHMHVCGCMTRALRLSPFFQALVMRVEVFSCLGMQSPKTVVAIFPRHEAVR